MKYSADLIVSIHVPENDTSEGGERLTRQELSSEARSHVANSRRHRLADTTTVSLGTLPQPSQSDQSVDFARAQGCRVKCNARALAGLVGGLTLTMTRALEVLG